MGGEAGPRAGFPPFDRGPGRAGRECFRECFATAEGSHLDLTQELSAVEKGGQIKEGKRQGKSASIKKVQKSGGKNCCENCYASCMLARRAFCWRALIVAMEHASQQVKEDEGECLGCSGQLI